MPVQRIMGLESEFGISAPGNSSANPMIMSAQVVNAWAGEYLPDRIRRMRWDYDVESPLRDARGFDMSRADADPSQLTDDDYGMANVVLPNGARFYVDHAHPEYSSPEVTNPRDAALWDAAGDVIAADSAHLASILSDQQIVLYKNNTDGKGASYGTHENYMVDRDVPFDLIVSALTPFFVTRCLFSGSGRIGIGQEGDTAGFQISSRADFFEAEVGLETTLRRPIINTRDEPHADPSIRRRLHVIIGDANVSHKMVYLKMGVTALVLSMIEAGLLRDAPVLLDPVQAMHDVSHDVSMTKQLPLRKGGSMTALEIQHWYLAKSLEFEKKVSNDEMTHDVLDLWKDVLLRLEHDLLSLRSTVDWVCKYALMSDYMKRDSMTWADPRLAAIDIQYSDLRAEKGLALRMMQRGDLESMFTAEEIALAVKNPPTDTRAYFRGNCVSRYTSQVAAASWDSLIFDVGPEYALQRIATTDPFKGTAALTQELLNSCERAEDLVKALQGPLLRIAD